MSFEEFIPLFHTMSKKKGSCGFEAFSESFRIFDRDNNGMVSVAEVRHLLTSLGKSHIFVFEEEKIVRKADVHLVSNITHLSITRVAINMDILFAYFILFHNFIVQFCTILIKIIIFTFQSGITVA